MPSARYSFGATVCPDDPICRSIGNHPESQIGRDAARSPPSASANCFDVNIFLLFDAASDRNDNLRLRQIHRLLRLLEHFLRVVTNDSVGNINIHRLNRSRTSSSLGFVAAKCSALERREPWRVAREGNVSRELPLKHLPREYQLAALMPASDAIADHRSPHGSRELRHEIAYLIRMRHEHQLGLLRREEVLQPRGKRVRSVRLKLRRLDRIDLRDFLPGNFCRN